MTNYIEIAVAPLKNLAVEGAEEFAKKHLAKVKAEFEAGGWDLNVVAPYPSRSLMNQDLNAYSKAHEKYTHYMKLVPSDLTKPYDSKVSYRAWSEENASKFVEEAKRDAGFQFDKYVAKLVKKIGEVKDAEILPVLGVWGCSILTVTLPCGTVQRWKTQQIYNVSKLGKVFPQWPTRKMK